MQDHVKAAYTVLLFACRNFDFLANRLEDFTKHGESDAKRNKFKCEKCNHEFDNKNNLDEHKRVQHLTECRHCKQRTDELTLLKEEVYRDADERNNLKRELKTA